MKVSIIIPVYNSAPAIERCICSVLKQSWQNLEIILVDDHGTDNSIVLASRLLEHPAGENAHPPVAPEEQKVTAPSVKILHHSENRGLSAARNTGLDAATGDYVFFLDCDDEIPPRALENLVLTANLYSHPHLVCGAVDVRPDSKKSLNFSNKLPDYIEGKKASSQAILRRDIPIMACNKLVNRDFLISNKLYFKEGLIHEDNLWSYQVSGFVDSIAITRQVTYIYHLNHKGLTMERVTPKRLDSIKTIITMQIESLSKERPLRTLQEAYIFFTAAWFLDLLYVQSHPQYYNMRQWVRNTLRPFGTGMHYHTLVNHLLYRAIYLPPAVLRAGKKFRENASRNR
ncbi:MAG TPA: glycosyltransferase family 2 protein [Bacteroidales bacterium]|nr:glycosyltransferase family 2 protein [Bacteroidales bacterium]OQB70285.1 MAG: putative glycosyltransferase EpsH [Bacteroidetes bacterium ADurb.Bin139]HOG24815.1 glycosyltransferase family 2 protein [Bacteroidales bacterium]HOR10945.1 glycosyltransferase family 2 protein [Bacteroidales bacterium]HPB77944.1 glycosyltransferase family 2 protein [Bacteroidales bacterium]